MWSSTLLSLKFPAVYQLPDRDRTYYPYLSWGWVLFSDIMVIAVRNGYPNSREGIFRKFIALNKPPQGALVDCWRGTGQFSIVLATPEFCITLSTVDLYWINNPDLLVPAQWAIKVIRELESQTRECYRRNGKLRYVTAAGFDSAFQIEPPRPTQPLSHP